MEREEEGGIKLVYGVNSLEIRFQHFNDTLNVHMFPCALLFKCLIWRWEREGRRVQSKSPNANYCFQ